MPLTKAEGGKVDVQLSAPSGIDCNVLNVNQRGPGIMGHRLGRVVESMLERLDKTW